MKEASSKIIVTQWKAFRSLDDVENVINQWIADESVAPQNRYVALPYTYLKTLSEKLETSGVVFGSDFMDPVHENSFTGSIAPRLLKEAGARFVLIGTAERRKKFGETSAIIREKVQRAAKEKLIPFLCIGENAEEFLNGKSQEVLALQLKECLEGLSSEQLKGLTIIYEATWMDTYPYKPSEADLTRAYEQLHAALNESVDAKYLPTLHLIYAYPYDINFIPSYFQTHPSDGYYFEKPIHYSDLSLYELHADLKPFLKEPHISIAAPGILEITGIDPVKIEPPEENVQPEPTVEEEIQVVISKETLDTVLDETISPVGEQVVKNTLRKTTKSESV